MNPAWYQQKISEVLKNLLTEDTGLTWQESRERLEKYGLNKIAEAKMDSLGAIILRQFQSPLIYILLLSSLIVFLMGETIDGLIILFVLLFNALVGTIQEGKSQNTLLALKKFTETSVKVVRDGKEVVIPDFEVVPGDILLLHEGDKVAADCRLILVNNLTVDESALNGESTPVHKTINILSQPDLLTPDQKNMVFK